MPGRVTLSWTPASAQQLGISHPGTELGCNGGLSWDHWCPLLQLNMRHDLLQGATSPSRSCSRCQPRLAWHPDSLLQVAHGSLTP